jgi:hypothetical protein
MATAAVMIVVCVRFNRGVRPSRSRPLDLLAGSTVLQFVTKSWFEYDDWLCRGVALTFVGSVSQSGMRQPSAAVLVEQ